MMDFSWQSLTVALNKVAYRPGQVGRLGLFRPVPQVSVVANVEIRSNRLALIPEIPRGAPPTPDVGDLRALAEFRVPHFPARDLLMADAVQDVRAFGSLEPESYPAALQQRIDSLGYRLDGTLEFLRLGATKGVIVTAIDRDTGAPLKSVSLFDAFGVSPQPPLDWPIVGAGASGEQSAWDGQPTGLINQLGRAMAEEVPGGMLQGVHGFAGANFFDAFSMHPERRAAYIGFPSAATVGPVRGNAVTFRDVTIEEYRGSFAGVPWVDPDTCYFVPREIPDLFVEVYSPADFIDTVNTLGMARYLRQEELDFRKGTQLEAQMNVLPLCTSPRALFTATISAYVPDGGAAVTATPAPAAPATAVAVRRT
jgi:hypothetical protein